MSGLSRLRNMFRVPDLRNKILFTVLIVAVYRVGAHLPVPYVDFNANTNPVDCTSARPIVRYRVHCVIFF